MIHSSGHESILSSLIESRDTVQKVKWFPPIITLTISSQLFIRNVLCIIIQEVTGKKNRKHNFL